MYALLEPTLLQPTPPSKTTKNMYTNTTNQKRGRKESARAPAYVAPGLSVSWTFLPPLQQPFGVKRIYKLYQHTFRIFITLSSPISVHGHAYMSPLCFFFF